MPQRVPKNIRNPFEEKLKGNTRKLKGNTRKLKGNQKENQKENPLKINEGKQRRINLINNIIRIYMND
tara:strand:+ start:42 stop:245 length:204 start_codon:yes stop_codon:yes gene_type:complete